MSNFLTYRERISEGYNLIIGKPKALCFDAWYNCVKISKIKFSRVESITQVYRLKSWDLKALVCLLKNTTMNQLIFSGCILYYFLIVLTTNFFKKIENKTVLESDSDDITDSESSSYSPECNKCLGVRPVCLSRCNCLPHYLCIYFEKEFKSFWLMKYFR